MAEPVVSASAELKEGDFATIATDYGDGKVGKVTKNYYYRPSNEPLSGEPGMESRVKLIYSDGTESLYTNILHLTKADEADYPNCSDTFRDCKALLDQGGGLDSASFVKWLTGRREKLSAAKSLHTDIHCNGTPFRSNWVARSVDAFFLEKSEGGGDTLLHLALKNKVPNEVVSALIPETWNRNTLGSTRAATQENADGILPIQIALEQPHVSKEVLCQIYNEMAAVDDLSYYSAEKVQRKYQACFYVSADHLVCEWFLRQGPDIDVDAFWSWWFDESEDGERLKPDGRDDHCFNDILILNLLAIRLPLYYALHYKSPEEVLKVIRGKTGGNNALHAYLLQGPNLDADQFLEWYRQEYNTDEFEDLACEFEDLACFRSDWDTTVRMTPFLFAMINKVPLPVLTFLDTSSSFDMCVGYLHHGQEMDVDAFLVWFEEHKEEEWVTGYSIWADTFSCGSMLQQALSSNIPERALLVLTHFFSRYPKSLEALDDDGRSILHTALENDAPETVTTAIIDMCTGATKGQALSTFLAMADTFGDTPLHVALNYGLHGVALKLLEAWPGLCMVGGEDDRLPLHIAVSASTAYADSISDTVQEANPNTSTAAAGSVPKLGDNSSISSIRDGTGSGGAAWTVRTGDDGIGTDAGASGSNEPEPTANGMVLKILSEWVDAVKEKDLDGNTPLQLALICGASDDITLALLNAWPDGAADVTEDPTLLHLALQHNASERVISALLKVFPGAVNIGHHERGTPLYTALECGAPESIMKDLFGTGSDVEALHLALENKASESFVLSMIDAQPATVKDFNLGCQVPLVFPERRYPGCLKRSKSAENSKLGIVDANITLLHVALENNATLAVCLAILKLWPDATKQRVSRTELSPTAKYVIEQTYYRCGNSPGSWHPEPSIYMEAPLRCALRLKVDAKLIDALTTATPTNVVCDMYLQEGLQLDTKLFLVWLEEHCYHSSEWLGEAIMDGNTALHTALLVGISEAVMLALIRACPEAAQKKNADGNIPLHVAILKKSPETVMQALVTAWPAGIKVKNASGKSPLHSALYCYSGVTETVMLALIGACPEAAKENETSKYGDGETPLHIALKWNDHNPGVSGAVLKALMKNWPDAAKEKDAVGRTPLYVALWHNASEAVLKDVIELWPDAAKVKDAKGRTPLHVALENNASDAVLKALMKNWPDAAEVKDAVGRTPLYVALWHNASEAVLKDIIELWPDAAKVKDVEGRTPLHVVLWHNASEAVLKDVIELWPDAAKVKDVEGRTPLHVALENHASEAVLKDVIELWPDATKETDERKCSPLHLALQYMDTPGVVTQMVYEAWSDAAGWENSSGQTPFMLITTPFKQNISAKLMTIVQDAAPLQDTEVINVYLRNLNILSVWDGARPDLVNLFLSWFEKRKNTIIVTKAMVQLALGAHSKSCQRDSVVLALFEVWSPTGSIVDGMELLYHAIDHHVGCVIAGAMLAKWPDIVKQYDYGVSKMKNHVSRMNDGKLRTELKKRGLHAEGSKDQLKDRLCGSICGTLKSLVRNGGSDGLMDTPLHFLADKRFATVAQCRESNAVCFTLVAAGADIKATNADGKTPQEIAVGSISENSSRNIANFQEFSYYNREQTEANYHLKTSFDEITSFQTFFRGCFRRNARIKTGSVCSMHFRGWSTISHSWCPPSAKLTALTVLLIAQTYKRGLLPQVPTGVWHLILNYIPRYELRQGNCGPVEEEKALKSYMFIISGTKANVVSISDSMAASDNNAASSNRVDSDNSCTSDGAGTDVDILPPSVTEIIGQASTAASTAASGTSIVTDSATGSSAPAAAPAATISTIVPSAQAKPSPKRKAKAKAPRRRSARQKYMEEDEDPNSCVITGVFQHSSGGGTDSKLIELAAEQYNRKPIVIYERREELLINAPGERQRDCPFCNFSQQVYDCRDCNDIECLNDGCDKRFKYCGRCLQPKLTPGLRKMCEIACAHVAKRDGAAPAPGFEMLPRMARILAHPDHESHSNNTLERVKKWLREGVSHRGCGSREVGGKKSIPTQAPKEVEDTVQGGSVDDPILID